MLRINSERAESLAQELSELTGESITEVVVAALEARLVLEHREAEGLLGILEQCSQLPSLDDRTAEEILGYDENGLPT